MQVGVDEFFEFYFVEWVIDIEALVGDGAFEPSAVGGFGWSIFGICGDGCTGELCDAFDESCGVGDGIVLELASDFFEVLFIGEGGIEVEGAGSGSFEVDEDDLVGLYGD